MLSNQSVRNEKPQLKGATSGQGKVQSYGNSNSTTQVELKESKSRCDKGMELYKQGKVSVTGDGLFKVSGYYHVDTGKMQCECPDYKTHRCPCKHIFACLLFTKNRGKQRIEHLNGFGNGSTEPKNGSTKPVEGHSKEYDRQRTITKLAVLNTATEILKTHRKPIEFNDIVSLAAQLEKWALGN